ncbi:Uncharacterised protein [Candidatus Gugararchaeum adminiculabundum]|nr:Uncharacterised protein [Candidatus Gugararchaeum adminiculabundum]
MQAKFHKASDLLQRPLQREVLIDKRMPPNVLKVLVDGIEYGFKKKQEIPIYDAIEPPTQLHVFQLAYEEEEFCRQFAGLPKEKSQILASRVRILIDALNSLLPEAYALAGKNEKVSQVNIFWLDYMYFLLETLMGQLGEKQTISNRNGAEDRVYVSFESKQSSLPNSDPHSIAIETLRFEIAEFLSKQESNILSVPRSLINLDTRFDQTLRGSTTHLIDQPFTPPPLCNPGNQFLSEAISSQRVQKDVISLYYNMVLLDGKPFEPDSLLFTYTEKKFGSGEINPRLCDFVVAVPPLDDKMESMPGDYAIKRINAHIEGQELKTEEPELLSRITIPITRTLNIQGVPILEIFEKDYRFELVQ